MMKKILIILYAICYCSLGFAAAAVSPESAQALQQLQLLQKQISAANNNTAAPTPQGFVPAPSRPKAAMAPITATPTSNQTLPSVPTLGAPPVAAPPPATPAPVTSNEPLMLPTNNN